MKSKLTIKKKQFWNIAVLIKLFIRAHLFLIIFFYSSVLLFFNQKNLYSPLQRHLFSDDKSRITCHSHEMTAITIHNDSINSPWRKSSPALHFFLSEKCFSCLSFLPLLHLPLLQWVTDVRHTDQSASTGVIPTP